MRRPAAVALASLLAACAGDGQGGGARDAPTAAPGAEEASVPEATGWEGLRWTDGAGRDAPGGRERHLALRAWLAARSRGFRHVPVRRLGNFVSERWCGPAVGEAACDGGAVVGSDRPGDAWRQLEALAYPSAPDDVFGVGLSVGSNPPPGQAGVAAHLWLWEGGARIVGDGLRVQLLAFDAAGGVAKVELGDRVGVRCVDVELAVAAPGGGRAELARLAASPASLVATARERLAALEAEATGALAAGRVQGFDEGPYLGRGLPPERTPRALTPAEVARETAAVRAEVARRVALVEAHAAAFHRALVDGLPVELLAP